MEKNYFLGENFLGKGEKLYGETPLGDRRKQFKREKHAINRLKVHNLHVKSGHI